MIMKFLYIHALTVTRAIAEALFAIGYDVDIFPRIENDMCIKKETIDEIACYIRENEITHLVSIHFIYNFAVAAQLTGIKYMVIVWDAPYYSLFTPYGRLDNCYFSVFDKVDYQRFVKGGIPHVLYQPLSIDGQASIQWGSGEKKYLNEISFVGRLYDTEKGSPYDSFAQSMPGAICKYFDSIFEEAAFQWDGVNRIYGKTDMGILEYLKAACPEFQLDNVFEVDDMFYFESYHLVRKIANIERICILNALAEEYDVTLYTDSSRDVAKLKNVKIMPSVATIKEAPAVYHSSKINLNLSLHGIEGGTPQRIMDIMGAGGFVLSSYCSETAELFEEDKEIVMFKNPEELMEKVNYYLTHDEERENIARAGHEKVMKCYTYDVKMKAFLDWVEEQ